MDFRRIDKLEIPDNFQEIRLFSIIRNEKFRIPFFIEYYRKLGISRFFFIDNNSTDKVQTLLLKHKDVHVFSSTAPFGFSAKKYLKMIVKKYGHNGWNLVLDADEFFEFPGSSLITLREFIDYLEMKKIYAFKCLLLDMYSRKKLEKTNYLIGNDPFSVCRYFDYSGYTTDIDGEKIRGGVRGRIFDLPLITLSKYPLFKGLPDLKHDYWGLHENPNHSSGKIITGILFHFKFFSTFISRAKEEARREEHVIKAYEYKAYTKLDLRNLVLYSPKYSLPYFTTLELYALKLIKVDRDYLRYIWSIKLRKFF